MKRALVATAAGAAWVVLRLAQYFERLENNAAVAVAVAVPELVKQPVEFSNIVKVVEDARRERR